MDTTLIRTKLRVPNIKYVVVERDDLLQQLNQNPERMFTLVSAPAGFGKTTLIASWLSAQSALYSWLSLDRFDNDLSVFLRYLVAAIQRVFPESCATLSPIIQLPDLPPPETLAALVINEVNALPHPFLLVLDDYHAIDNSEILQLVERIVEQSQNHLHLVIISRMDPFLPLPRLRLQQGLVEIRRQDLRFSDHEAAQFLSTAVSDKLNIEAINSLNYRVEGWIAGLRLASLSMQNHDQHKAITHIETGDAQDFIANYLFTEVLSQQPSAVQKFLLQTAFMDRFCADLCEAIMDFPFEAWSVQDLINYLKNANLFIIPLDEQAGWFRYHHLFQQMLQQKAAVRLGKTTVKALRKQTGDWFAQQGFVDEALQQYLSAGDMATAVALIEANSRNLLNGLARQRLERWMTLLPDEIIWERPRLLVAKAWLLYRHWRLQALAPVLAQIQACLDSSRSVLEVGEKEFVLSQMYTLNCVIACCVLKDFSAAKAAAEQAIRFLPAYEQGALATAISYRALSLQALGEEETAVAELQQYLQNPAPQRPAWAQLYLGICFTHLNAGNLLPFYRTVAQFLARASETQVGVTPANWVSGIAHYEANRLDAARQAFATTVDLHFATNFMAACDSWLSLARVCQEQGALAQAQQYLDTVHAEALRLECVDLLPAIEAVQAYQYFLEGNTAVALRWAVAFDPNSAPDYIQLTFFPLLLWVRIIITHGDDIICETAKELTREKLIAAQKTYHVRRQIQLLAHLALIESRLSHDEAALIELQMAIELGQAGGFVRSLLDCGPALRPYLQQLQQNAIAPHYIEQLLAAYPAYDNIEVNGKSLEPQLTERETEILQMMFTGCSNKEIARELVISLYTVKRHASNIYRKLDVNGRSHAIHKATKIGILTPE